jgi:IS5 family transposase
MLRDRYENDKLFDDIARFVPKMNAVLVKIDPLLADETIFTSIKAELARRYPLTLHTGRRSTPVEVILRMLVVKRLYQCSYEETERRVADSLGLRQFCRLYLNPVPDDTTLMRWAKLIRPAALEQFNAHITHLATELTVTHGHQLRTDGTVVETNIHPPSDSRQLADSVRMLARTVEKAHALVSPMAEGVREACQQAQKSAKKLAHHIGETLRKRSDAAKVAGRAAYEQLIELTQTTMSQAEQMLPVLQQQAAAKAAKLADTLQTFLPRAQQAIDQTVRRVFQNEKVPAGDKIVSIFEPHTDIIKRGKENQPVEYGHKVWLDEVDGGIITHWRVLEGNPSDTEQWTPSLRHHIEQFGQAPEQASADRGVYSAANEAEAGRLGVVRAILPKPGYRSAHRQQHEHQPWFTAGRNWHAGVEGRISVLKRCHGLDRCLDHGQPGFECWIGWGVIAANLRVMGRTLATRKTPC